MGQSPVLIHHFINVGCHLGIWTLCANAGSLLCQSHTLPLVRQWLHLLVGKATQFLKITIFKKHLFKKATLTRYEKARQEKRFCECSE
jgi:hypothetical protein